MTVLSFLLWCEYSLFPDPRRSLVLGTDWSLSLLRPSDRPVYNAYAKEYSFFYCTPPLSASP